MSALKKTAALVVLALLLPGGPLWGVSPRVGVCTPAKTPPAIDGKLDDACWKSAGVVTDFLLDSGKGISTDPTIARICFDRNNLYIGLECYESRWNTVKATKTLHDSAIDSDDDIEIFFDTNSDRSTYYQFLFNTLGTKSELLSGGKEWDCNWTVKVTKLRDRWVAEVAIPMKVLGGAKIGETWGFNVGRGQAGQRVYASFAGIKGRWGAPGQFATLKFAARASGEGRIFKTRSGFRTFALHPQKALDLLNLPSADDEYLAAFGTPGEVVPYTFHVFNLERKRTIAAKISATAFTGAAGRIAVPKNALLYLYPKIAGSYAWNFLGEGDTVTVPPGQKSGFWLDLGNRREFVPRALKRLAGWAREYLVFNLLHVRAAGYGYCAYYDPAKVLPWVTPIAREVQVIDDYLPNDFTVICRLGDRGGPPGR